MVSQFDLSGLSEYHPVHLLHFYSHLVKIFTSGFGRILLELTLFWMGRYLFQSFCELLALQPNYQLASQCLRWVLEREPSGESADIQCRLF
jgi:hypothetical protein